MRWGVAAPGRIAARFANGMSLVDSGRIVAVASRAKARADEYGDRFGVERRYGSYDELAADPEVDIVYVASPHSQHAEMTLRFLDAGKHVLCEKPLALNYRQAVSMTERARARGLFLMEAMWTRFLPSYVTLAGVLAEQRIGTPLVVESDFGFRAPFTPAHRLFDPALGGGAALDLGIYPLQLCSLVLGPPSSVAAVGHVGETGVDEQIAAVLHHAGGALGVVKAATRVTFACTARISGTEGWIDLPPRAHDARRLIVGDQRGTETIELDYDGDGLRFQVEEVHRCLADGVCESPVMPLDESCALAATLDTIRAQVGVRYPTEED